MDMDEYCSWVGRGNVYKKAYRYQNASIVRDSISTVFIFPSYLIWFFPISVSTKYAIGHIRDTRDEVGRL